MLSTATRRFALGMRMYSSGCQSAESATKRSKAPQSAYRPSPLPSVADSDESLLNRIDGVNLVSDLCLSALTAKYCQQQRFDSAQQLIKIAEALVADKKDGEGRRQRRFMVGAHHALIAGLCTHGRLDEAFSLASHTIRKDLPLSSEVRSRLVDCFINENRLEEAIFATGVFTRPKLTPLSLPIMFKLYTTTAKLGNADAIDSLNEALRERTVKRSEGNRKSIQFALDLLAITDPTEGASLIANANGNDIILTPHLCDAIVHTLIRLNHPMAAGVRLIQWLGNQNAHLYVPQSTCWGLARVLFGLGITGLPVRLLKLARDSFIEQHASTPVPFTSLRHIQSLIKVTSISGNGSALLSVVDTFLIPRLSQLPAQSRHRHRSVNARIEPFLACAHLRDPLTLESLLSRGSVLFDPLTDSPRLTRHVLAASIRCNTPDTTLSLLLTALPHFPPSLALLSLSSALPSFSHSTSHLSSLIHSQSHLSLTDPSALAPILRSHLSSLFPAQNSSELSSALTTLLTTPAPSDSQRSLCLSLLTSLTSSQLTVQSNEH